MRLRGCFVEHIAGRAAVVVRYARSTSVDARSARPARLDLARLMRHAAGLHDRCEASRCCRPRRGGGDVDSRLGADGLRGHANQEARKRPINSETSSACVSIAKVCEGHGVPWSVVRAISDRASDGGVDAAIVGLTRPDGRPDFLATVRYLIRHRDAVPRLVRLGRGAKLATQRAADAAIEAVS